MSAPLTEEERQRYADIINGILATANLEQITRKQIRQGLEAALRKDTSDHKDEVKELIRDCFEAFTAAAPSPPTNGTANGHTPDDATPDSDEQDEIKAEAADDDSSQINVVAPPPTKRVKRENSDAEDADAKLAARLQAQENQLSRSRTTRGGGITAAKPKKSSAGGKAKSAAKKKSEKRVRDSDAESDGEDGTPKEKRKAGGGFSKPFVLSPQLQELVGETQMSRPQVVKKLWEYIKGNDLQDPEDRRQIRCDEKMQAVFRVSKVNMFSMNKTLGNHLSPPEEA